MNETWADPAARVLRDIWDVMGWPTWLRRLYVLTFPLSLVLRAVLAVSWGIGLVIPLILADRTWKDWLLRIWQGTHSSYEGWPTWLRRCYVATFPLAAPFHLVLWIGFLLSAGAVLGVRDWIWPDYLRPIWMGVPVEREGEEYFE